ncbi:hypothetical protein [Novosphingobium sp.]|jgi:hypothetical protein|uniref:hypothetical protein n=1 Tax=Novosphingobium sp. TaxID=1874826 RepID=UPI002FDFCD78
MSINETVASPVDQVGFDIAAWTVQLRNFLENCAGSAPCEEIDRVREAMRLLRPGAARPAREGFDPAGIDAMLACGATESAVLALIGEDEVFIWSRGLGGNCLATLVMPDGSEELMCEAATLSLALLSAYVSKLLVRLERREQQDAARPASALGIRLH